MIRLYVETTIGLLECVDVCMIGVEPDVLHFKGRLLAQDKEYVSLAAIVVIDAFERSGPLPGTFVDVDSELHVTYSVKTIKETSC